MNTLIIKLGATGDVVRTTPLLHRLHGQITWVTAEKNTVFVGDLVDNLRCFAWPDREKARDRNYDLVINLEDTVEVAEFLRLLPCKQIFGAYLDSSNRLTYTDSSRNWFDLSIISRYGKTQADKLKLQNRRTYQDLIFEGLGLEFATDAYLLPRPIETDLSGDVAVAAEAGPVWPMKKWAFYNELKLALEKRGLVVNILPQRSSLLQHLSDIANHRVLVGGDSLPMHLALGTGTPCVSIFNCTSPWEIYGYDIQKKLVSPLLEEFFYKRGYDQRATKAITMDEVEAAVLAQLESPSLANHASVK